ncbi:hypothetical protein ICC18_23285 [Paenibacillus sp. WST5]|uniref:Uncharacterized protein n=2 Tax=Paenibacillus sedimenti TaxID=2770274 RepID=A0A926KVU3_9BACL|nr:hypothetical protein [Paenibacillus sedimenti]
MLKRKMNPERMILMVENNNHAGNYTGSANMSAENQDMEFVNDTLENAPNTTPVNISEDDISEEQEDKQLNQK